MEINKFEDLTKFDKKNAKVFLQFSFDISNWSLKNDDKFLPMLANFNCIKTFDCYDSDAFKYRKFCGLFYSKDLNIALIGFAGTEFTSEWFLDFDYKQINPLSIIKDEKIFVHIQHYNIYNSLRDELIKSLKSIINDDTVVVSTGHSLGGSVASICFLDLVINNIIKNRTLYTFGSPRTGNTAFAKIINDEKTAMRLANTADLATSVPPPIIQNYIYTHYEGIYFIMNLESYSLNHGQSYTDYF